MFDYGNDHIKLIEVGPRDGLQNEKKSISLADKLHYIDLLTKTGLKTIEATSFVRADKIPQMSNAVELFNSLTNRSDFGDISFPCLVPNMKGYLSAKTSGVKEISLFSATSDAFTKKNINCSIDESFTRMKEVSTAAKSDNIKIRAYISTAFGCPYAGEMSAKDLMTVIEKFLKLGVYEISVGDTIGVANPKQVASYIKQIEQIVDLSRVAMHFHDTRGMAIANILVSLESGVRIFDASSGGLGGCPYAKGASGNVATEELLYLFDSLGLEHGVSLSKLTEASKFILSKVGRETPSKYLKVLLT